ncbi:MAG: DNA polymerase IV [Peptoniphilaceae bacterium]|nr:DNA polymerase IV [Peptoniphilaceae bacterium]MDY6019056.1 DNA polymerase IV [Anaerococcus sp.]
MINNIMHIDCDAFYASCEELRNPHLKAHPMAVGGLSNKSIITTANYKARKFGICSAMPVFMAKEKCRDLIIVPVDRKYYIKKSREIFAIVKTYARVFEQVSIDEAYIEINSIDNPYKLAQNLQQEVLKKTGIGISIGISYNKFLAKLGSDWNKPRGIKEIKRQDLDKILPNLPISKVHGLGKKTCLDLESFGIYKISDLLKLDKDFLEERFGKNGSYIYQVIRGVDKRKVKPRQNRKSIARETTFKENTKDKEILFAYLDDLAIDLEEDLKAKNIQARTVNIKIKYDDFSSHTKSLTLQEPLYKACDISSVAKNLFNEIFDKKSLRLIGISLSKLSNKDTSQLSFI